jgi:hypothetical protein
MGQSLSALDDAALGAGGGGSGDEGEGDAEAGGGGGLSAEMVARANFGGFMRADDDDVRPRSVQ